MLWHRRRQLHRRHRRHCQHLPTETKEAATEAAEVTVVRCCNVSSGPAVLTEPVPVEAVASVDVMDSGQHAWSRPVRCHRRRQLHWCPQAAAVRTSAMVMAVDEWERVNQSGGGQRAWPRDLCSAAGGGSCTVGTAATISALVHTGGDDGDDGSDGG